MLKNKRNIKAEERWLIYPYRWAHHPLCEKFSDHVYTIKGYKICRGCFNMYLGMLVGMIIIPLLVLYAKFNYLYLFILLWFLFLPTPLSVYLHARRVVKDISRQLLGIGIITTFTTITVALISFFKNKDYWGLVVAIIVFFIYVLSYKILSKERERRNRAICMSCEQYGLPKCEGLESYYERAIGLSALREGDAFGEE